MFRYLLAIIAISVAVTGNRSVYAVDTQVETMEAQSFTFDVDGSRVDVQLRDAELLTNKDILLEWVQYSAATVHHYYGRFPVSTVNIELQSVGGNRVRSGRAFGGNEPQIYISVGNAVTADILLRDWIMVHEMTHLAMANVPRRHSWLLEGLATYVESIARAQRGHISEQTIWRSFIQRMPQGLPASGDRGLDRTPTWGRKYWGGAMFCMLADIEIRKLTDNRKSLRDALRGVLDAGMSMHARASAMEVFEAADRAVGVDVLVPLYQKMKHDPYPVDLDALWRDLGVRLDNGQVVYDDAAPMSPIRQQLLKS